MRKQSLRAVARSYAGAAGVTSAGRASKTVYGGHEHRLRQTVIALVAGRKLKERASPGEATVLVLEGRVRLNGARAAWEGIPGDLIAVPHERHSLEALTDTVFLLTTVVDIA